MKRIVIMGIPHHGNLGDNAIALAEEELIKKYFSDYELLEIPEKFLNKCIYNAKKYIKENDIILLHGGGNIGDTYIVPEQGRREVIKLFPNNKIIIFPQTAYFEKDDNGKKELEISKQIYNEHKNLVILAREEKSYDFMKEHFYNAKVYLTPDIVMTLSKKSKEQRDGALLLFRGDKEKTLQNNSIEKIKELVNKKYKKVVESDMHLGEDIINIAGEIREKALEDKFKQFQTSEVVITDRLHGMIFAAITQTPCIAFKSFNHKISESYKWLKDLEYIQLCERIEDLESVLEKISKSKNMEYNNEFAEKTISEILKKEINIVN